MKPRLPGLVERVPDKVRPWFGWMEMILADQVDIGPEARFLVVGICDEGEFRGHFQSLGYFVLLGIWDMMNARGEMGLNRSRPADGVPTGCGQCRELCFTLFKQGMLNATSNVSVVHDVGSSGIPDDRSGCHIRRLCCVSMSMFHVSVRHILWILRRPQYQRKEKSQIIMKMFSYNILNNSVVYFRVE